MITAVNSNVQFNGAQKFKNNNLTKKMSRKIVDVSIEPPKGLTEIASQVKGEINKKNVNKVIDSSMALCLLGFSAINAFSK